MNGRTFSQNLRRRGKSHHLKKKKEEEEAIAVIIERERGGGGDPWGLQREPKNLRYITTVASDNVYGPCF